MGSCRGGAMRCAARIADDVVVLASRVVVLVAGSGGSHRASRDRIVRCLQLLRRTIAMPPGTCRRIAVRISWGDARPGRHAALHCGDRWVLARIDFRLHSPQCRVHSAVCSAANRAKLLAFDGLVASPGHGLPCGRCTSVHPPCRTGAKSLARRTARRGRRNPTPPPIAHTFGLDLASRSPPAHDQMPAARGGPEHAAH